MKKLLILGASPYEIAVVNKARSKGIYTIVTDQYVDLTVSPAKLVADEAWNISWSDIDALEQKCKEVGVDGVVAGYSEFRVENLIKLTSRLQLPCYCNIEQLETTRDKILFKEACRRYGVPVVPQYNPNDELDDSLFPVIVKPVDRGGSIGITVAYNQEEYKRSKEYALSLSPSKNIIVEKFMRDYQKMDLYYIVVDGKYYCFGSSDTVMNQNVEGIEIAQREWLYNSVFEKQYIQTVDPAVKSMMAGLNFQHGYITYSAFAKGEEIFFFETGYRFSGEQSFRFCEKRLGFDYLDVMISEALSLPEKYAVGQLKENIYSKVINFHATRSGKISRIIGVEELSKITGVDDILLIHKDGEQMELKSGAFPYVAMITISSDNKEDLDELSARIKTNFDVLDENGKSMILH